MTTVIQASEPARFLSLLPHLAGFTPRESLVLVPFAERRTIGALRIDLPEPGADLAEYSATAVGLICKVREADRVAIVVYTDAAYRDGAGRPAGADLVHEVLRRAHECGLPPVYTLCVAADAWGDPLEPGGPDLPLDDIQPADVELDDGPADDVSGDQDSGCALPPSDLATRERVANELRAFSLTLGDPTLPALIESAILDDPTELSPRSLAQLIQLLDRPALRDVALHQWCGGYDEGVATQAWQIEWTRDRSLVPTGPVRLAGEGAGVDPRRLERALELARRLAACAPRANRAGPLVAAAWLSWALGRSTHAAHYVGLVRELDPNHGLAGIVAAMISAGHLPEWVFDRSARTARSRAKRSAGRR
ncbi:DUF4192 family protein [Microbacterium sp. NPDC096154]|uniref:DUF4192 family protein n=1 Tax=Microbacterium sp. NPDC096154 TaxID=3155549 RepID=UPI00332F475E